MCDMFGGPSSAETNTLSSQQGLSAALSGYLNQQYAQQQDVLSQLNNQIQRIQTGQTGPGFSGAENAARISLIQNVGAARARNAIQASRATTAGAGQGGTSALGRESGIQQQVAGGIEAMTGADTANALLQEQAENFAQGRQNATQALAGFQALSGDYNPLGYAGATQNALNSQFNIADKINQQNIAKSQAIAGLVTKGALSALTFGAGGIGALGAGESMSEGIGDFFKGGVNALTGTNFGINPGSGGEWSPYSS